MRRPITPAPSFSQKPDGARVLDDLDETTWVFWEERSKASESVLERTVRHIASAVADTNIRLDRFRRMFMRVSIRRGAPSLLLYEREEFDAAAPLKIYDLTSVTDITKEDLSMKDALQYQVKHDPAAIAASAAAVVAAREQDKHYNLDSSAADADGDNGAGGSSDFGRRKTAIAAPTTPRLLRTTEMVSVYGQILLRLHFGAKKKRTDGGVLSALGLGGFVGRVTDGTKNKSKTNVPASAASGGNSSGGDASSGGGGEDSACLAFYTAEDRDSWYAWFSELALLRQRSLISAQSGLLDDVEDPSPSLFGFSTAVPGGADSQAADSQLQRVPIVGERAFLRSQRGRDALRDYARMFLESSSSSALDAQSMGVVQVSRNTQDAFKPAEITGILNAGELTFKFKAGPIVKEKFVLSMADYRVEASSASERELYLWYGTSTAATAILDSVEAQKRANQKQLASTAFQRSAAGAPQIAAAALELEEQFNWVLRSNSFENRAMLITWLRRLKGKGDVAQTEEETYPYLRQMLQATRRGDESPMNNASPPRGSPDMSPVSRMKNRRDELASFGELFSASAASSSMSTTMDAGLSPPLRGASGGGHAEEEDLLSPSALLDPLSTSTTSMLPTAVSQQRQRREHLQQQLVERVDRVGDELLDGVRTPRSDNGETARSDDDGSRSVGEFIPFCTFYADVVGSYLDDDARLHLFGSSVTFGGTHHNHHSGAGGGAGFGGRASSAAFAAADIRARRNLHAASSTSIGSKRAAAASMTVRAIGTDPEPIAPRRRREMPTSAAAVTPRTTSPSVTLRKAPSAVIGSAGGAAGKGRTASASALTTTRLAPSGAFSRHDLMKGAKGAHHL